MSAPGSRFDFLRDSDIESREPPPYLIDGVLVASSLNCIWGKPEVGKSFLALDWAMSVATGQSWLGKSVLVPGPVIYCVAEGARAFGKRLRAWKDHRNVEGDSLVRWLEVPVPLMDYPSVALFLEGATRVCEPPPVLIVFDTLSRCFGDGDENSAADMGHLVANLDTIRDATDAAVLLLHHPNKSGDSERGSTVLGGAADGVFQLQREAPYARVLTSEKAKDVGRFDDIHFRLKPHLDSLVVTASQSVAVGGQYIPEGELQTLRALRDTAMDDGLAATIWEKNTDVSTRTFYRHRKSLCECGLVEQFKAGGHNRYRVSDKGLTTLGVNCQSTANALPGSTAAEVPAPLPLKGGGAPASAVGSDVAEDG